MPATNNTIRLNYFGMAAMGLGDGRNFGVVQQTLCQMSMATDGMYCNLVPASTCKEGIEARDPIRFKKKSGAPNGAPDCLFAGIRKTNNEYPLSMAKMIRALQKMSPESTDRRSR